ncbi:MAG: MOSC domain-containing protein [Acidimicrobiia bacterium]|nr:MOSC domain-containing protein [Acidimicrobiia bacterium]
MDYTLDDVRGTVGGAGELWRHAVLRRDPSDAEAAGRGLVTALASALDETPGNGAVGDELDRLARVAVKSVDDDSAEGLLDTVLRGWSGIVESLRQAGQVASSGSGSVVQLNRSGGGVPKLPVSEGTVGPRGLEGDAQATRRHHGRPWQALCLWSAEVVDAFAADGHPIAYGSAGENMTIGGLDWSDVQPGVRLRVGSALAEVSAYALPCSTNSRWFLDGDHALMHHERGPVSRVYAWVREPGAVATGDEVSIVP